MNEFHGGFAILWGKQELERVSQIAVLSVLLLSHLNNQERIGSREYCHIDLMQCIDQRLNSFP